MVDHVIGHGRLVGVVQRRKEADASGKPDIFLAGCVGYVSAFNEILSHPLFITLKGLTRFKLLKYSKNAKGFWEGTIDFKGFEEDLTSKETFSSQRERLLDVLRSYLALHDMGANWEEIDKTPDVMLVNALTNLCPFDAREKQVLLESKTIEERCHVMTFLIEMAMMTGERKKTVLH
jgi:Lon protease-like protein